MTTNRPRIVFRADATRRIGGGHIVRCLALAAALSERGCDCTFATVRESSVVVPTLGISGHPLLMLDHNDDPASEVHAMMAHWPVGIDLIIVDHHQRDASYEKLFRGWARHVAAIDGLNRAHDCDMLINPNLVVQPSRSQYRAASQILEGGDYVLISTDVLRLRPTSMQRRADSNWACSTLLLTLGASTDPAAYQVIIEGVAKAGVDARFVIVTGTNGEARETSKVAVRRHGLTAEVHGWTDQMAQFLASADAVIGGGGNSLWDRCCLGVPSLTVVLSPNQSKVTQIAADQQATLPLGDVGSLTADKIERALSSLLRSSLNCKLMSQAAAALVDGLGCQRISDRLLQAVRAEDELPRA